MYRRFFFFFFRKRKRSYLVVRRAVTLSFSRYLSVSFFLSLPVSPLEDLAVTVTVNVSALFRTTTRGGEVSKALLTVFFTMTYARHLSSASHSEGRSASENVSRRTVVALYRSHSRVRVGERRNEWRCGGTENSARGRDR